MRVSSVSVSARKVDSDPSSLIALHDSSHWTPRSIRPRTPVRLARAQFMEASEARFATAADSVLADVYGLPTCSSFADTLVLTPGSAAALPPGELRLTPTRFPYDCPPGTHHACLWYFLGIPGSGRTRAEPDDVEVNSDLERLLPTLSSQAICSIEAIWYRNPKPSVLDDRLFHVQVFWRQRAP
jgi:hypothetical protein